MKELLRKHFILEKNQYFLVEDNIAENKDSRYKEVGCVEERDMIGKVIE